MAAHCCFVTTKHAWSCRDPDSNTHHCIKVTILCGQNYTVCSFLSTRTCCASSGLKLSLHQPCSASQRLLVSDLVAFFHTFILHLMKQANWNSLFIQQKEPELNNLLPTLNLRKEFCEYSCAHEFTYAGRNCDFLAFSHTIWMTSVAVMDPSHQSGRGESLQSLTRFLMFLHSVTWVLDAQKRWNHIKLHDETPSKHRARPIHPQDVEAVLQHLRDLLEAGVIRESESSFSWPIIVVCKKNGDIHLCSDYRKPNLQTIKDTYLLPGGVSVHSVGIQMVQHSGLKIWILPAWNEWRGQS